MRRAAICFGLWLLGGSIFAAAPPACPSGFICIPRDEVIADAEKHYEWREEIARLKVRARRFGCVVGVGAGASGAVTEDWDLSIAPAAHIGITCGLRFP